jgi:tetratricopeptide (TPR) repeat protein
MKIRYLLPLILPLLLPLCSIAAEPDTSAINGLFKEYKNLRYDNPDSARIKILQAFKLSRKAGYEKGIGQSYFFLADYCESQADFQKAHSYMDTAETYYRKINDFTLMAELYNLRGITFSDQGLYQQSLDWYNKEVSVSKPNNYQKGLSLAYSNTGVSYFLMGEYGKAITYYLQGIRIYEETKDSVSLVTALNNLSVFYQYKNQYKEAIRVLEEAINYARPDAHKHLGDTYNNMGVTYRKMNELGKAREWFLKSLEEVKKSEDQRGIANIYNNLADLEIIKGNYDEAINYFRKTLEIHVKYNYVNDIAYVKKNIGIAYLDKKDFAHAEQYAREGLKLSEEIGAKNYVRDILFLLADIYQQSGRYKEATECMFQYKTINDSLVQEEYEKNLAELQTQYKTDKQLKQIQILKKDQELKDTRIRQQDAAQRTLIIGIVLSGLLVLLIGYSYIMKQRANKILRQKNHEIAMQRDAIAEQNVRITQQNEEITAQRDEIEAQRDLILDQKDRIEDILSAVTDSIRYAKRIQQALLPAEKILTNALPEHFVLLKPRDVVSGDFYWFSRTGNHLVACAADCTGHGVPGAFMSMLGISFLNEIVTKGGELESGKILDQLRHSIINALQQRGIEGEQKDGMDIALVSVDLDNLKLQFSGANNPLYIVRREISGKTNPDQPSVSLQEIKANKMPIAIYVSMESFTTHELTLSKGDTVYLFSDGFADQFGGTQNKKYMYKQLRETLVSINPLPLSEQKCSLTDIFENWKGSNFQVDDVLIMGIRI